MTIITFLTGRIGRGGGGCQGPLLTKCLKNYKDEEYTNTTGQYNLQVSCMLTYDLFFHDKLCKINH